MLKEYKDFKSLSEDVREDFAPLLRMKEVKDILGCGWDFIFELVREGELQAVDITGRTVDRGTIDQTSRGLRVPPSSLQDFLNRNTVK